MSYIMLMVQNSAILGSNCLYEKKNGRSIEINKADLLKSITQYDRLLIKFISTKRFYLETH